MFRQKYNFHNTSVFSQNIIELDSHLINGNTVCDIIEPYIADWESWENFLGDVTTCITVLVSTVQGFGIFALKPVI